MKIWKIGVIIIAMSMLIGVTSALTIPTGKLKIQAIPSMPKVNERVKFMVTTELTNKPVANAEIWIAKVGAKETVDYIIQLLTEGKVGKLVGYTNQNGEFYYRFGDWGIYVVQAKKEGYVRAITTVEVKPLGRLKVSTEKSGWTYIWVLSPEELAKMSVDDVIARCGKTIYVLIRVTDENGNPIKDAEVFVNLKSKGYTDKNGEIEIGLKPGVYVITAKKKGYLPGANVTVTITKEDIENKVKKLIEEAKRKVEEKKKEVEEFLKILKVDNPKVVKAGEEFEIKVTFEGEPVSDAMIFIRKHGIVVQSGKTDANGVFKTSLNEEGVYVIKATKEGYRDGVSVVAVVPSAEVKPLIFVHIMPVIEPEKPGIIEVGKAFIKSIEVKVKKKVKDVIVEVKRLKELPKEIPKPPKLVYAYVEITVTVKPTDVEEGTITFNVSKEWLAENNIDKNTVTLMKYVNGKWIPLETRIIGEDDQYVYYEAKTPGFSIYAITGSKTGVTEKVTPTLTKTPQATPTPVTTTPQITKTPSKIVTPAKPTKTPGFEVVAAAIAVGIATILRRKI